MTHHRRRPPLRLAGRRGRLARRSADALASLLDELGGKIETGVRVRIAGDLPPADVVLLDLAPGADRRGSSATGCRPGSPAPTAVPPRPGAFKVDFAIEGGVPWTNQACGRAGTVHLGGTFAEIAAAERDIAAGGCRSGRSCSSASSTSPTRRARPATSTRSRPTPTCPHGYTGDATEAIIAPDRAVRARLPRADRRPRRAARRPQTRRRQPQLRRRRHRHRRQHRAPARLRARASRSTRTRTGIPGVYLCSAATPARRRRPRHVRLQRRRLRPAPPPDPTPHLAEPEP